MRPLFSPDELVNLEVAVFLFSTFALSSALTLFVKLVYTNALSYNAEIAQRTLRMLPILIRILYRRNNYLLAIFLIVFSYGSLSLESLLSQFEATKPVFVISIFIFLLELLYFASGLLRFRSRLRKVLDDKILL